MIISVFFSQMSCYHNNKLLSCSLYSSAIDADSIAPVRVDGKCARFYAPDFSRSVIYSITKTFGILYSLPTCRLLMVPFFKSRYTVLTLTPPSILPSCSASTISGYSVNIILYKSFISAFVTEDHPL